MVITVLIWFGLTIFRKYFSMCVHTEKSFRNHIKSTRNQIVFTILLDWFWNSKRTQSVCCSKSIEENGKYNLISDWLNKISRRTLSPMACLDCAEFRDKCLWVPFCRVYLRNVCTGMNWIFNLLIFQFEPFWVIYYCWCNIHT